MNSILIGCAQMGWPENTPEIEILTAIANIGYEGVPAGPRKDRTAQETLAIYKQCGLKPAPGYFAADYWRLEQRQDILKRAQAMARFTLETGCTDLYVATGGWTGYYTPSGKHRGQIAGRVTPADGLTDAEWQIFADTLNQVGEVTLKEGVRSCFHNHVGSIIESGEEMDRMLAMTNPDLIFLGPDTGHMAWAGVDVVDFCQRYANRIKTIHVKDVKTEVVKQGVTAGWEYNDYTEHGLFAELGEGDVDFTKVFQILKSAGFSGWVIVETDMITRPTAVESHTVSLNYLRKLGL